VQAEVQVDGLIVIPVGMVNVNLAEGKKVRKEKNILLADPLLLLVRSTKRLRENPGEKAERKRRERMILEIF